MKLKLAKKKTKSTLSLPEVLDAYVAEDLKIVLLEALNYDKPFDITADKVSTIDTVCCQLLVAGQLAFHEQALSFDLKKSSAALLRSLNRLGLNQLVTGEMPETNVST